MAPIPPGPLYQNSRADQRHDGTAPDPAPTGLPGSAESLGSPVRVLLVDDDHDDYVLTRDLLAESVRNRYQVDWISSYDEALESICHEEHDVYVFDYVLGDKTGLQLLEEARQPQAVLQ